MKRLEKTKTLQLYDFRDEGVLSVVELRGNGKKKWGNVLKKHPGSDVNNEDDNPDAITVPSKVEAGGSCQAQVASEKVKKAHKA
ncbi:hypothetical protein Bca52824_001089 [Brassica carinata]|uniref:Uncharacterized protein n=1 Tax=Brassica carinata TaxID=52824 RepID=A0A8X7WFN0_BRACI|nr:hypothetical protein Bca52824_001089 [Brassica carinata]